MNGVRVRPAAAADSSRIDAVEAAAFGDHAAAVLPLIRELRRTGAAVLELVAEVDAEVVGHVLLSRGWIDAQARLVPVRVLSPLAVLPARQRQGFGRALIEHAVATAEWIALSDGRQRTRRWARCEVREKRGSRPPRFAPICHLSRCR